MIFMSRVPNLCDIVIIAPPSPGKMHVSLAEALEVRGGPLQEEEVWAVLSQSAESLQELFRRGMGTTQL